MRIAILASERTGSTTLYNFLKNHLINSQYHCHCEPFNSVLKDKINRKVYPIEFYNDKNNVLIKTFLNNLHIPPNTIVSDYWEWFFNYFEKIILLDRRDKNLQSESFSYHESNNDVLSWQRKQFYDMSKIDKLNIENRKKIFTEESKILFEYSKKGYPLFYYEDIFLNKDMSVIKSMVDYINLPLNNDHYKNFILLDTYKVRLSECESKFNSLI